MRYNSKYLSKELSQKEILNKLYRYCAYQERAISDVDRQLNRYRIEEKLKKNIIEKLIEEDFLNEERYTKTYVFGKLRNNKWGRIKITQGLKEKSIDPHIIHKVIDTIEEKEYIEIINNLIVKREALLRTEDIFIRKNKIARSIISKGFESTIVWDQINELIKN